jgi:hypothetical protein
MGCPNTADDPESFLCACSHAIADHGSRLYDPAGKCRRCACSRARCMRCRRPVREECDCYDADPGAGRR